MLKQAQWILLAAAFALPAQEKSAPPPPPGEPKATYRLEFTISELEGGKKKETRSYSMLGEQGNWDRLRIGNRVPIPSTGGQFQYFDLGVNVDALPRFVDPNTLRLNAKIEVSAVATGGEPAAQQARPPVVRNFRSEVEAVIPLDKPVLLTSQDEPFSHSTFQLQVVARLAK